MPMQETEVIIIGAGPAGLGCAGCLTKAGIPYIMLEKTDRVASAWHRHYERLHLHSEKKNSELPYLSFPADYPKYVSRLQLIDYLNTYAKKFKIEPRFEEEVHSAIRLDMKWRVKTNKEEYWSRFLVIATGLSHKPRRPVWPGMETFQGPIIHTSQYKNGKPYTNQNVLVVGFGNSGGEIAIDLHEHGARPSLSVRGPVNIVPKEVLGINSITLSLKTQFIPNKLFDSVTAPIVRLKQGNLKKMGLQKAPIGPREQVKLTGRIPLIDIGTMKLLREGEITAYPDIKRIDAKTVTFVDDRRVDFDCIILGTGYTPDFSFLVGGDHLFSGNMRETGPKVAGEQPGLFFTGVRNPPTGAIRGMGDDARTITDAIKNAPPVPKGFPKPQRPPLYAALESAAAAD